MACKVIDIERGISGNIGHNSWVAELIRSEHPIFTYIEGLKENTGFNFMPMKEIAKIPEKLKPIAEELNKDYGLPIDFFAQLLKLEYRKQIITLEKEKLRISVEHMDKLYKEDKELTDITRALECEDFYEYQ